MTERKKILLVFDDEGEMAFMQANLLENGFNIYTSNSIQEIQDLVIKVAPDLIVLNTLHTEYLLEVLNTNLKAEQFNNTAILSLIDHKDYLYVSNEEYFIIKPIRPKILLSLIRGLMNHENVRWLPSTPLMLPNE